MSSQKDIHEIRERLGIARNDEPNRDYHIREALLALTALEDYVIQLEESVAMLAARNIRDR